MKTYSLVENGKVIRIGLSRPKRLDGKYIDFAEDLRSYGYYPEVGTKPATGPFEEAVVDTATLNGDVVEITYRIVDLPPPKSITPRQAKQQLVIAGLDDQVTAAIDGIADATEQKLTRIWYEDSEFWERDNPQLQALADALSLTDEQVDDLFRAASQR